MMAVRQDNRQSLDIASMLALKLFVEAGNEPVRVIERIAAALINQMRAREAGQNLPSPDRKLWHDPAAFAELHSSITQDSLAICNRIARRALSDSFIDPTGGANAFHRFEDIPEWAFGEMPLFEVGAFVFYRLSTDDRA